MYFFQEHSNFVYTDKSCVPAQSASQWKYFITRQRWQWRTNRGLILCAAPLQYLSVCWAGKGWKNYNKCLKPRTLCPFFILLVPFRWMKYWLLVVPVACCRWWGVKLLYSIWLLVAHFLVTKLIQNWRKIERGEVLELSGIHMKGSWFMRIKSLNKTAVRTGSKEARYF